jgi:hypothetical protein
MSHALLLTFICVFCAGTATAFMVPTATVDEAAPPTDETFERLITIDEIMAVRAAFDEMLLDKGLITGEQLELIRHGTKSRGVVTAMRTTGAACEDFREVELDLMVKKAGGGQFPAHETALVPASSLERVYPGSVIDTYYRPGDESTIAVCVPPS